MQLSSSPAPSMLAGLPGTYTFTAVDWGKHGSSAVLKTAGIQGLTATDDRGTTDRLSGRSDTEFASSGSSHDRASSAMLRPTASTVAQGYEERAPGGPFRLLAGRPGTSAPQPSRGLEGNPILSHGRDGGERKAGHVRSPTSLAILNCAGGAVDPQGPGWAPPAAPRISDRPASSPSSSRPPTPA